MLQLLISGEPVDLSPDASITIDEESPVFDKDSIPGGFSFPFNLPVTPRNRRILGFPERIEKQGAMSTEQPFQLFHQGILRFSGTITVTEASDSYKANLMVGSGNLASSIKDKKLKDLDLGGVRTWEWKAEYNYPYDDFALAPIINTGHYTDMPLDALFKSHFCKMNAYYDGEFYHPLDDDPWVITPFPFLSYLVRQIFKFSGIRIIENVLISDPDFRDLILYTLRDISATAKDYITTLYGIVITHADVKDITSYVFPPAGKEVTTFDLAKSMPDVLISDFLLSVRNFLNLSYIFEEDNVRIIKRQDLILQPAAIDITSQAIGSSRSVKVDTDGFSLEWAPDGDDTLWGADYFKNIDEFLAFVGEPLQSLSDLETLEPEENEIRFIIDENVFLRFIYFAYDPDDVTKFRWQWVSWSMNYQNCRNGNAGEVFKTDIAPILTVQSVHFAPGTAGLIKAPWVEQKGAISDAGVVPPFALRLMFYRGLIHDSLGADYPYATNDNLDRTGTVLPGKSLALRFDGESGIYAQLWSKYLTWWMSRKLVYWTIKDPSTLSFAEKYVIDGKQYLLKKRTVNLTQRAVEPGECEFYLV